MFLSFFDLETAIEIRQEQTFHKITYNTIILARRAIKFLDWNVLCISKVLAFSIKGKCLSKNFKPSTYLILDMKDLVLLLHWKVFNSYNFFYIVSVAEVLK